MRYFKFRAWDKFNENMSFSKILCDFFDDFQKLKEGGNSPVLMQFVGLKDKNNNEVYEGDIVKCDMIHKGGPLPHMGEIVWLEEFGAFATRNEAGNTLFYNHFLNTFEVVGNVYENPELLQST